MVLIRGILGLQNRVPEWELLFKDIRQFSLTLLPLENGKETCTLAHISFHSSEDLQAFQKCAGFDRQLDDNVQEQKVGDVLRYARRVKGDVVLFIESSPAFPEVNSYVQMIVGAQ